jgi:hypothetical protein
MEAIFSSQIVQDVFDNYPAYIHEYVGDDDSSTKKVLRHLWQDEMDRGMREEVPQYKNKQKKPDSGRLPIDHPSIVWLADKGQTGSGSLRTNSLFFVGKKSGLRGHTDECQVLKKKPVLRDQCELLRYRR